MAQVINWYPGHMFKAKKELISQLKIIDIVIEVIDARVPISSHNEMLDELTKHKTKLLIFTKADLVNDNYLKTFINYYEQKGYATIAISTTNSVDRKKLLSKIKSLAKPIQEKALAKGITKLPRVLIMGMPNVGKSSVINFLVNRKKAVVGNTPGVTRQQQWIKVEEVCELLDTPGILIPKIEDITRGYKLVACGLIKDEVVELEHVATYLLEYLVNNYPTNLISAYHLDIDIDTLKSLELFEVYDLIAQSIGAINRGESDYMRVSVNVISYFRKQKFGLIILDQNV